MSSTEMNMGAIDPSMFKQMGEVAGAAQEAVQEVAGQVKCAAGQAQDIASEVGSDGTAASNKAEMKKDSTGMKDKVKKPEQVEKVEKPEEKEKPTTEQKKPGMEDVKSSEQMGRALMMGQLMTQAFDTLMSGGDIAKKIGDSGYGKKAGSEILGQISQKLGAEQKETKESVKGLESAVGELQGVVDGLKEKLEGLKGELEGLGKEKQAAEGTPQQEEKEGAFQAKSKEVDDTSGELQAKTAELEGMTDKLEGAKEKLGNLGAAKQKIDDAKQNLGKSNYLDGVKDVSDLASKICQATADVAISMMAQKAGSHGMRAGLIRSLASAVGDMIQTSKSTPELQSAMTGAKNLKAFSTVTTAANDGHTRMAKENFALKKEGGEQATQAPPQRPQRPAQTARPQASQQPSRPQAARQENVDPQRPAQAAGPQASQASGRPAQTAGPQASQTSGRPAQTAAPQATQQAAKPQGTQGAKNFEGFSKTQQPGTGNVKLTNAQGKSFSLQQGSITQTNFEGKGKTAIVNAANPGCKQGGSGTNAAVTTAVTDDSWKSSAPSGGLKAGQSSIGTWEQKPGTGEKQADHLVQSLGPNYQTGQYKGPEGMAQAKQEMMSAYKETFAKCKEQGVENVQMTLLSTGIYAANDGNAAEWQQMSRECLQEAASEALADPNSSIKNITVVDYASAPKMQGINA